MVDVPSKVYNCSLLAQALCGATSGRAKNPLQRRYKIPNRHQDLDVHAYTSPRKSRARALSPESMNGF
eukprot:762623-Prorocentrum_minimum.AAC.1